MSKAFVLLFLAVQLIIPQSYAEEGVNPLPAPEMTVVAFSNENGDKPIVIDSSGLGHVISADFTGGTVVKGGDGFDWTMGERDIFATGRLNLTLDRRKIRSDLAMVLNASLAPESMLAVQLYDADGKALALDLFGDLIWRTEGAGTDTLIIPLERYPDAVKLVLRRLSGGIVIREILLTPVLSETGMNPDRERNLAILLGEKISVHHRASKTRDGIGALTVHTIPSLREINEIGASALSAAGYPEYRSLGLAQEETIPANVSGTVYDFAIVANRFLSLQGESLAFDWSFTSSSGVESCFGKQQAPTEEGSYNAFGLASVPMNPGAREAFFKHNGFYPIEFPIARNAIEVIANASLPIDSMDMDGLRKVFGEGGAITWGELGLRGASAELKVQAVGGSRSWGTSRMFREIVLGGGAWREDMIIDKDVVYPSGVEASVAGALGGIGYAVQRKRGSEIRKVMIRTSVDAEPVGATEQAIYSGAYPLQRKLFAYIGARKLEDASSQIREMANLLLSAEGQTMMVKTNSLPLSASEVIEWRARLGL